jgi:hypothetical protein
MRVEGFVSQHKVVGNVLGNAVCCLVFKRKCLI